MEIKKLSEVVLTDIDLVLLDLDNTLYDYHICHNYAMQMLTEAFTTLYNVDADKVKALYKQGRQLVHDRHHGTAVSHSRLFYLQYMVEKLDNTTSTQTITKLYNIYWDSFIEHIQLFNGALPFLQRCRELAIPVIMVTDMTTEVQFKKIAKLGIEPYFNYIVTSEEAGIEKPHPFIFEYAINKALRSGQTIRNIAVVGDDVKKDLHFSEIYTMHTFHISYK